MPRPILTHSIILQYTNVNLPCSSSFTHKQHRCFVCGKCNRRLKNIDTIIKEAQMKHGAEKAFSFKPNKPFGKTITRASTVPEVPSPFACYAASLVRIVIR